RDFHVTGVQTCALPISAALSGSQETFRSVARHGGLIVVDDADEMTEALMVMSRCKLPLGRKVGIVATSGDVADFTADQCSHYGQIGRASCRERGERAGG